jgi:elongation factor Ts
MPAMNISLEDGKVLREQTGASLKDVQEALKVSKGDKAKALEWLRQRGAQIAEQRQARATGEGRGQGRVESYVHHDGRLGASVEIHCETDFVARTQEFIQLCRDVAMHVAAMSPRYIRKEEIPAGEQADAEERNTACLLDQPFVKDPKVTVGDLLKLLIGKTGENIVVRRFARFEIGEPPRTVL